MHVRVIDHPDGTVVITVRGNLDVDSAGGLLSALDAALERPVPRIVVDLSGIDFCDSTGLSAFVIGHNRVAGAGGWLRLAAPSAWVARLLHGVGLARQLGVHATVADALAAPSGAAPAPAPPTPPIRP
jgi:anti-sigma B factor antagonist